MNYILFYDFAFSPICLNYAFIFTPITIFGTIKINTERINFRFASMNIQPDMKWIYIGIVFLLDLHFQMIHEQEGIYFIFFKDYF